MTADETLEWQQIHDDAVVIDLHAHPTLKVALLQRVLSSRYKAGPAFNPFSVRTSFPRLQDGGLDVLLSTVYVPEKEMLVDCRHLRALRYLRPRTFQRVFGRGYLEVATEMLDAMEDQVQAAQDDANQPLAQMVYSVHELDDLLAQEGPRPIAVIHSLEGAHVLEGDLANLDRLYDRGVCYITLAHFYENEAIHPCLSYPESVQTLGCFQRERDLTLGLTGWGEDLLEKMVELGVMPDVSHSTPPARQRVYEVVGNRLPILATHVGAYEVNPSPYNLKDWEMAKIAESGGVAGVIFMNYWLMPHETKRGLNFIARTLEHFVDAGGIEHVGLGSDFDGFTDPPDDLKDASEFPRLTQRLIAEGYDADQIKKILGGNSLRVIREGWGRQA
jgi:membrane dipeptidase